MTKPSTLALLALLGAAGCMGPSTRPPIPIGTARASADFHSYDLRRVGVLPPEGDGLDADSSIALRDALAIAFTAETTYEMVPLGAPELESVGTVAPARSGRTQPDAILDVARRTGCDAILSPRVVDLRWYEPVRLGLEVDLIAVETGLVIWTSQVKVDTGNLRTLESIAAWQGATRAGGDTDRAVDVLSPRRLGEFAAAQVAMLL